MRTVVTFLLAIPIIPVCLVLEGLAAITVCCRLSRTEIAIRLMIDFLLSVVLFWREAPDAE